MNPAKSTPLDHLPRSANESNVQMNVNPSQQDFSQGNAPQPSAGMGQGHPEELNQDSQQNNYVERQFVQPSTQPQQQMPMQMQMQMPQQQMPQQPMQMPMPMPMPQQASPVFEDESYLTLLFSQSKLLAIVFGLLMAAQMEPTQAIFRKITRMVKVPDSMVFVGSKLLISLVGVVAFLIIYKNL